MAVGPLEEVVELLGGRYYGKYRGTVVSNREDPARGLLLVSVPAVHDDPVVAWPSVPYAGRQQGFYALPPEQGQCWVEYEAGDPSHPIWSGCFWGDGELDAADARPEIKMLRTASAAIRIDDSSGTIEIETGGSVLTIQGTEITLKSQSIASEAGGKKVALTPASFDVDNGAFTVV